MDGIGSQAVDALAMSDSLFANGCIVNQSGMMGPDTPPNAINSHAIFDTARRMSQCVRILPCYSLEGYALEGGKSVLWFRRTAAFTGNDWFDGIADAIAHTAPAGGWTNEWLLDFQWKAYHPSYSSIWKADAYGQIFTVNDRCGFYAPEFQTSGNRELNWQVALGLSESPGNIVAEMPTGYRYMPLDYAVSGRQYLNQIRRSGTIDYPFDETSLAAFQKSCKIYKPPYEIESAVTEQVGNWQRVKVTLTTRLEHCDEAPGTISSDISTWDGPTIASEPYRTDENAVRLWIVNQHGGAGYNPPATQGDRAAWNSLADDAYASILPHIYLVQLIPEPYDDGNDTQDAADTPLWHDVYQRAEWYIRAMCEGYVDGVRSADEICTQFTETHVMPDWGSYDFTFENLCAQAFGQRDFGVMPADATQYTRESQTRQDAPHGFGHLPNTRATAELHNRFADAVNLMDKVRLMVPYEIESRVTTYLGSKEVTLPMACNPDGSTKAYHDHDIPPPVAFSSVTDWESGLPYALRFSALIGCPFQVDASIVTSEFRAVVDADIVANAFPPIVTELYSGNNLGLFAGAIESLKTHRRIETTSGDPSNYCGGVGNVLYYDDKFWAFEETEGSYFEETARVYCFGVVQSGSITSPELPPTDYGVVRVTAGEGGVEGWCSFGGSESSLFLDLAPQNSLFLQVPLV